jgi:hypothetical protein
MSLTKLPRGRNNSVMTSLFPPRESLVVKSRLGTGNSRTFFLQCACSLLPLCPMPASPPVPYLFPCLQAAGVPHADLCLSPCPLPPPPCPSLQKNSENDAGFLFLLLHCVGPPRTGWDFLSGEISTPGGRGGRQQGARPIVHPQACFRQCVCQVSLYRQEHLLTSYPRIAFTLFFLTKVTNNMSMHRIFLNSLDGKLCFYKDQALSISIKIVHHSDEKYCIKYY